MSMEQWLDGWLSKEVFVSFEEKMVESWNAVAILAVSFTFIAWAFYSIVGPIVSFFMR
jgi:hypothetical protein